MNIHNRWLIAAAGVLMQVAFGAVYAWSVFRIPLTHAHGWTIAEVTAAFEIAIFVVGLAAFAGGLWMRRSGPRPVALAGAVLSASKALAHLPASGHKWMRIGVGFLVDRPMQALEVLFD